MEKSYGLHFLITLYNKIIKLKFISVKLKVINSTWADLTV